MSYKRTSHLRATPVVNGFTQLWEPPIVPDFTRAKEFTINQKYNKRPDLLAYDLYGESRFWWVFAIYNKNDLVDPINDFVTGTRIWIPDRDYIAGI